MHRLGSGLMCPACGNRRVTVVFEPPSKCAVGSPARQNDRRRTLRERGLWDARRQAFFFFFFFFFYKHTPPPPPPPQKKKKKKKKKKSSSRSGWFIPCGFEIVCAFAPGDERDAICDGAPEPLDGAFSGLSKQSFEF